MKRIWLILYLTLFSCEDTKNDEGYSFPKLSKKTVFNSDGTIDREIIYRWDGNVRKGYRARNGIETDTLSSVYRYNQYGGVLESTSYNLSGDVNGKTVYERDKWKILSYKKYNRSDELSSHNIFEWDGLTAREIDAKSNSLIYTHIYDEKSNKIYEKFELQTFEYISTWEWDPKYRQRLLNYTVGPNSFTEDESISYEWIGNKCIGKNIDGTLSGDSWEVNEFDDRIKYTGRSGRVFIQEYLDERFEPYFTPDI